MTGMLLKITYVKSKLSNTILLWGNIEWPKKKSEMIISRTAF